MIYHGNLNGLSDYGPSIAKAAITLAPHQHQFDTIVCSGISGLLYASPLALIFNKHLVVVRKDGEYAHSETHPGINDMPNDSRWIFVDDFIGTGTTRRRCYNAIAEHYPASDNGFGAICVGVWTERDGWSQ